MDQQYLYYSLVDGYVHHWLVAGPQYIPIHGSDVQSMEALENTANHFYQSMPGVVGLPQEQASITAFLPGEAKSELIWNVVNCEDDHILDLTDTVSSQNYLRTWAYCELAVAAPKHISLSLHTFGPAEVWLNDVSVLRCTRFGETLLHGENCEVDLVKGQNKLLVRMEQFSSSFAPYGMALKISNKKGIKVCLPTATELTKTWQKMENVARAAYLDHDLLAGKEELVVRWPNDLKESSWLTLRLQTHQGRIFSERNHFEAKASASHSLSTAYMVPDGSYRVRIMADLKEYYELGIRAQRDLNINLLRTPHAPTPYATLNERAGEILEYSARITHGIYAEIAKMAADWWSWVDPTEIQVAIEAVRTHQPGCHEVLLGLLVIYQRYRKHASFPGELIEPIEQCILGFDYERELHSGSPIRGITEDLAILKHVCRIIAGQCFYKQTFTHSGETGRWHREQGEHLALTWLSKRAIGGFAAWNSEVRFNQCLLALVHLVDFTRNDELREMATVIMDKLLFTLATHTYQGVLGSTQGIANTSGVIDGRMQATSPVSRLLWGMGCLNPQVSTAVSLVCSDKYELPTLFASIAADQPEEMWSRESHVISWKETDGVQDPVQFINLVSYKTPDYMLSSAQDFRAGLPGGEEHIWQATLGPDAQVFVNHPACQSQKDAFRPNFWRGNRVNPRVAQVHDTLIAIHRLPQDDWMGYTHAHFPVAAFDEYELKDNWAFGRKGAGYIALGAQCGLSLITSGDSAYRELRSPGKHNIWLCFMGRSQMDGSFAEFMKNVLACNIEFEDLAVRFQSLRGDTFKFGWQGPLMINNQDQMITGFKHYETPYCTAEFGASLMEIKQGDWMLRLNLNPNLPNQE